jgi:phage-related protein
MDISAATGKDLETVSLTLAKAYNGNIGALTKLGIPLDENIRKTKDFNLVQDELTRLFGGAAYANTKTYAGQLAIVTERFDEMKESIGVKILPILKTLLEEVNNVAMGFSGEDPRKGLSSKVRMLSNELDGGNGGGYNLGVSLKTLADSFGMLFTAMTSSDADSGLSALQKTANAINSIANAIEKLSTAYSKMKPFLDKLPTNIVRNQLWDWLTSDASTGSAMGGTVRAGVPVRVGEMGKEVFVPSTSGQIIPNHKLGGGGGNTFILNGIVDAESARRTIERIMQNSTLRTGQVNLAGSPL